jgi:phosphate acetyltransferase
MAAAADLIENRTFAEIAVGDSAQAARTLTADDIQLFAAVSGDANPAHLDPAFARTGLFQDVIAHGMWGGGLISAVIGNQLPGPGAIYLGQSLRFERPVRIGDTVTATVTVVATDAAHQRLDLDCRCTNQRGETVISGEAQVRAPAEKVRRPRAALPEVRVAGHGRYRALIDRVRGGGAPVAAAIAHPCSAAAVQAVADAVAEGLIAPILFGPRAKIAAAAAAAGCDLAGVPIEDAPHSHAAAAAAVAAVRAGRAAMLIKGSLHTDELMGAVVPAATGLRTERRISHAYVMDVPGYPRPLIITDAAINIAPSLEEKADICRNAIGLAHVLGLERPRVAILSAVETVNPKMRSTLEAAALCKMADRGQITGGVLDGPLAFDNAVSEAAAREKGIDGPVAGNADILVVPDIEAGNMLAKQLTFLAGADAAGVVLGAKVPIVLTSRADSQRTRLASVAVAVLLARAVGTAVAAGPAPA